MKSWGGGNSDWLKSGSGPVYLRTEAGYIPSDGEGPPIDPGLPGSPLAQPVLAPVYAMRGDCTKTGSPAAALQPTGKIALPKPYAREGIIVLEMDNEAAAPTARRGEYAVLRAENPAYPEIRIRANPAGRILGRMVWAMQKV